MMFSIGFGACSLASSMYIKKEAKQNECFTLSSMKSKLIFIAGRLSNIAFITSMFLSVTF